MGALSVGPARANDFDGLWFGGHAEGQGKVTMQAAFVGNLARFEIELERWRGYDRSATCQYYARLDTNGWGELILNSGSASKACARRGRVGLTRDERDWIMVSLAGLNEIPDFTLDERIRPLGEEERSVLPENFDILGVTLGMTRGEIEENLVEGRGYESFSGGARVC